MADEFDPRKTAAALLGSSEYVEWLEHRISTKTLDPRIEVMLWNYAGGRPPVHVKMEQVGTGVELRSVTDEELAKRVEQLQSQLKGRRIH